MKEEHYFYTPDVATSTDLPDEEAVHAVRVLRLHEGDELTLLSCQFSERKVVKVARLEKIAVSAMKQSRKAWKPVVNDMEPFLQFITREHRGRKFIAHCYEEVARTYLYDELSKTDINDEITVLIGPEGDFSIDEVKKAVENGYQSVHLGKSRLRTETAGLAAVMMMHLSKEQK